MAEHHERMPPLRGCMDTETAREQRIQRDAARARELKVRRVAGQASSHAAAMRGHLFDADNWKRAHAARQERIESTFTRFYQPTSKAYWVEPKPSAPKKPLPGSLMLPAYINELPHALSLSHPASREEEEDEEPEVHEELEHEVKQSEVEPFDPMAGPKEFYRQFKSRVSALRENAAAPPPTRLDSKVRNADKAIEEVLAEPPPVEEPPSVDELEMDPSLVYTDTAQYLLDFGVDLPMWDDAIDEQIRALDQAHLDALSANELAMNDLALDQLNLDSQRFDRQLPAQS
ncbi:hypothetical protein AB1Y20_000817 [Prymnesium parvum]|uniref:Uncharacterized protein n=1 Tax=Prymnesium parvum TaxID=97485 RepID=A0AB34K9Q4_PRYPA